MPSVPLPCNAIELIRGEVISIVPKRSSENEIRRRRRLGYGETNPKPVWKASAAPIADEADTGEAVPDRVSTCRIHAVDERAIRHRAFRYGLRYQIARPDRALRGSPDDQRGSQQRPFRKTDSSSTAGTQWNL